MKIHILASIVLFSSTVLASVAPTGRYLQVVNQMQALQKQYPQFAQIYSIGDNDDDVPIYAMRISTTPQAADPAKVAHLIVSTHHGNESMTPVFTMYFLTELLKRYQSSDLWSTSIHDTEWSIIPVLNISGYNANQRQEHGQDPNRDYPTPCATGTEKLKSIRLVMQHMKSRIFSGSMTVHGYIGTLTYPWGMYTDKAETLDDNYFAQITQKAAQFNHYRTGTHQIIYPANGSYEDYAYYKHGMWTVLMELESGSQQDIIDSAKTTFAFFDQLQASPSVKNQFEGNCTFRRGPDLRLE